MTRRSGAGQVLALVTYQLSYPVIIVRARLLVIGPQYEQAAIDLAATPLEAVRRVLLPMLVPAILVSTVLVFADLIDEFVLVRYLSGDASTEPVAVKIYNTARAAATPAIKRPVHARARRLTPRGDGWLPGLPLLHARGARRRRRVLHPRALTARSSEETT